ncbi:MAG: aspartate aminotransferase family protein, partial [Thiopseudomonas sp.]|nr:aspartate aminotransferase family protein [Thiopseudomonas sp.]
SYAKRLTQGLQERADAAGIAFTTTQVGGMFGLFFTDNKDIRNFKDAVACDVERFKKFFHLMLEGGVYLAPSAYEAGFVSAAMGETELKITLDAAEQAFNTLA